MKSKHVLRAKRLISSPGYPERRIAQITRRMFHNAERYFKRCDFSAIAKWAYDCEQAVLRRKKEWYEKRASL